MGKTIRVYGFPSSASAKVIKEFLEEFTGERTVSAVVVGRGRIREGETYVKVEFTTIEDAQGIVSLADESLLLYEGSFLATQYHGREISPKPKIILHCINDIVLHFGCWISKERFSVLWKSSNVSAKFGSGLRKLCFFLSSNFTDYKLELSYENIWQIKLHQPHNHASKFLVIQLLGAPRIFKEAASHLSYYMEDHADKWIREVDFTPFGYIGQSSAICLELPLCYELPNIREHFACFEEPEGQFILEEGTSYSSNLDLVPTVGPPNGVDLPYEITFKVNSLVQQGYLSGPTLDAHFFRMVDPRTAGTDNKCIQHALEAMSRSRDCCFEPVDWLIQQYKKYLVGQQVVPSPRISLDDGFVYVHRVQVTPSKIYCMGPEVTMSNRVLRRYAGDIENFLRVSFIDEELGKLHSTDLSPRIHGYKGKRTKLFARMLSTLRDGIVIGDKKFEFLAFSSSQLRDGSVWMFAPREGLTAADIRDWMGDFTQIRNVAKYAARLGQSFGSSTEALNVEKDEVEIIPDIVTSEGATKYVFSDGIGMISAEFAREVATKCRITSFTPSAFQIRYGGYKGVVAVDPTSPVKLSLRSSMSKYSSPNTKLDVLDWTRYHPCFLNRQVIILLSTLGIKDCIFEMKQKEAVAQLDAVLTDPLVAQRELELMPSGESTKILREMLSCGYEPDQEPFLSMMLRTFCASKLLELRTKSRMYIPKGRSMMGCLDETGTLEYGQAFVQFSGAGFRQKQSNIIELKGKETDAEGQIFQGKVVVAKNPCLHPGDIRVLQAVDVPALHHMVDCIVFPQKGKRPHPNECSGSDLDGDTYFVCWDPDLIPPRQFRPMDYTPAPTVSVDHNVTIEEVTEYFADYMTNDNLGIIANAHTVFADKEPSKACSSACLDLAELFSLAVDYPKTGIPAQIPPNLRIRKYPDFMEKSDKESYMSKSVIGKLYRSIMNIRLPTDLINPFTKEAAEQFYDPDMEVDGYENHIAEASSFKSLYDGKLRTLMDYYGIRTEAEILIGSALTNSRRFDKKRDLEGLSCAVRSLRKEARSWFGDIDNGSVSAQHANDLYAKASAWYHVTYHPRFWGRSCQEVMTGDHFLSFPWCVCDKLLHIKKERAGTQIALSKLSMDFLI